MGVCGSQAWRLEPAIRWQMEPAKQHSELDLHRELSGAQQCPVLAPPPSWHWLPEQQFSSTAQVPPIGLQQSVFVQRMLNPAGSRQQSTSDLQTWLVPVG